jgi:GNAT-family acetyltransferase (TIGR03103 family)
VNRRREQRGWSRDGALSTSAWREPPEHLTEGMQEDVALDCGWGRLVFGQTFKSHERLLEVVRSEQYGRRDICLYVRDPHVFVNLAPHELFLDPSYTYRLWFHRYRPRRESIRGVIVRKVGEASDADEVNRLFAGAHMVPAPSERLWANQRTQTFTYLVAEDAQSHQVVGTVTGVDHVFAFGDPEQGTSLWTLAVDPQCSVPGVGEALVRTLVERYAARGRAYLDLSVLHDNHAAIGLYEKLGFERVPVYCVKRKNVINEPIFAGNPGEDWERLNPYARIIADEARRRGIAVDILDPEWGELRLSHGGRHVVTRESLSELTSAVAMSRCDDKRVTRRILEKAGLRVARGQLAQGQPGDESSWSADEAFLTEVGEVVVKPARGEQGQGITVGVTDPAHLRRAVGLARQFSRDVLLEQCVSGQDLRVIVIGHEVIAAAVRKPATIVGTGRHSVRDLISAQSRRRAAVTGGESRIPLDDTTRETVEAAGLTLESVLPEGQELEVRRTANLHTGGTIHDVTADLHPVVAEAAVRASRALDIPVTGLDFLVPQVDGPDYVFIEANERPGLANHEPQPTAEAFVSLLFPGAPALPRGWRPSRTEEEATAIEAVVAAGPAAAVEPKVPSEVGIPADTGITTAAGPGGEAPTLTGGPDGRADERQEKPS